MKNLVSTDIIRTEDVKRRNILRHEEYQYKQSAQTHTQ